MTIPLRPMTTGELLDRTFNIYRNNFVLFVGISALAAVFYVAGMVLLVVLGITLPTPGARFDARTVIPIMALYFLILGLFYLIGASLATGATIYAVSKVHLGQTAAIGESYRTIFPWVGRIIRIVLSVMIRMIGVFLLMYIAAILVSLALVSVLGGIRSTLAAGIIFGIIIFGVIIAGYVFALRVFFKYSVAVQACVLEKAAAVQSLKRSAFLAKGSLWRIFLIYLLTGLIGFALAFVLQLPGTLLQKVSEAFAALIWQFFAMFLAVTISFPISTIAISLLYYDQRVRKEAFDLQLMVQSLGQSGPGQAAAATPIG